MQSDRWEEWRDDPMMILGRLLQRTETITETVQDTSKRVQVIEQQLTAGSSRMDQIEASQKAKPLFQAGYFLQKQQ